MLSCVITVRVFQLVLRDAVNASGDMHVEHVPVDGRGEYNEGGCTRGQAREGWGGYVLQEK